MRAALALLGPTASGKSALAAALAGSLPLEVVSMDSALVYRGMDIGTAKPDAALRARLPHHLIDVIDPDETYSAGRWRQAAIAAVEVILARGKLPLLVGGTMLYYRALAAGLDQLPPADRAIREAIEADAQRRGWPALHAELAGVDPRSAARIAPNDRQRIQRALEVWRVSGQTLSALHGAAPARLPFALHAVALVPERAVLHERIAQRFDDMLRLGLVDEVKALRATYRLSAESPSMRAVGYRQAWQYLDGLCDRDALRERGIAATRQLAKRQLTWLRSFRGVERLDPADPLRALKDLAHSFL